MVCDFQPTGFTLNLKDIPFNCNGEIIFVHGHQAKSCCIHRPLTYFIIFRDILPKMGSYAVYLWPSVSLVHDYLASSTSCYACIDRFLDKTWCVNELRKCLLLGHIGEAYYPFYIRDAVLSFADNLGIYLRKNKLTPAVIEVHDCLTGKVKKVDVDLLAAK